jgi:hypothetical protein
LKDSGFFIGWKALDFDANKSYFGVV